MPRIVYDLDDPDAMAATSGKPYTVRDGEKPHDWFATVDIFWHDRANTREEQICIEGPARVVREVLRDALAQLDMMEDDFLKSGEVVHPDKAKAKVRKPKLRVVRGKKRG